MFKDKGIQLLAKHRTRRQALISSLWVLCIYMKSEEKTRNEIIKMLSNFGVNGNRLAKVFEISRQRISVIINDYKTIDTYKRQKKNQALYESVMKSCGRKCVVCNSKKNLNLHHIDNNSHNNVFSNLAVVCHKCHCSIHKIDRESRCG